MPDDGEGPDEPPEPEYMLPSRPLREVTVEREILNILLPPPKRFSAEKALLIVPTLLSEPSARERGESEAR
jgi:hypothetical protein